MSPVDSFASGFVQAAITWALLFFAYYRIQKFRKMRRAQRLPVPEPKVRTVTRLSSGPERIAEANQLIRDYELMIIQAQTLLVEKSRAPQGRRRDQLQKLFDDVCERERAFQGAMLRELVQGGPAVEG